jgi:hypothetical protein
MLYVVDDFAGHNVQVAGSGHINFFYKNTIGHCSIDLACLARRLIILACEVAEL